MPTLDAWKDVLVGRFHDEVVRAWTNSAIMAIFGATAAVTSARWPLALAVSTTACRS